ncbi:MAG: molecular chaperone GrpE [Pseudonocardiales bacterium]|nr:molecular chaperone GrpE [Pseudonocardiales bacterium]
MADQEVSDRGNAPPDEAAGTDTGTEAGRQAELAELEDRWRRSVADLDNFRKRVLRDSGHLVEAERARVAAQWLPVLDNLELALRHAESDPGSIVEGVRAVRDQALAVLNRLGYPRRDDTGEAFDPALHEAVATVESPDVPAGTVVEVVRPGYGEQDRLLRPASVVVAKRAP